MPIYRHEIGNKIYVWSKSELGQSNPGCVISAHGEQTLINSSFGLGDIQLQFFAPHGHIVATLSVTDFLQSTVTSDYIVEDRSADYVLTKFQTHEPRPSLNGLVFSDRYVDLENLRDRDLWLDVVTIRNRGPFGSSIRLSEVIRDLAAAGYHYEAIACNFCRGPQISLRATPVTDMRSQR